MSKCSVQTVWILQSDGADVPTRDREFEDRIVPSVRALPGFVQGVWARSTDGQRSYNTMVFEDRHSADALIAQIETNKPRSAAAGVRLESLQILDVIVYA
ncbi:MAG: hypothetical protein M3Z25_24640 [Actinomycetota bacterium]|nr:hypothetical protein [Actinomycetota bacterium]